MPGLPSIILPREVYECIYQTSYKPIIQKLCLSHQAQVHLIKLKVVHLGYYYLAKS